MTHAPAARKDDTFDVIHGQRIDDPYRWLEDADSADTADFVAAANAHSRPILDALPGRAGFAERVAKFHIAPARGCPFQRGGRFFAWHNDGQNLDVLVVADTVDDLENAAVVLDANTLSDDGTVSVSLASVNQDGTLLAYATSDGGSDWLTVRVRDVATGEDRADIIEWTKFQSPTWMPDGQSFTLLQFPEPTGNALTEDSSAPSIVLHRVGTAGTEDTTLFTRPDEPRNLSFHALEDDDWFVITEAPGSATGNAVGVRRHSQPDDDIRWIVDGFEDSWHPLGIREGCLLLWTTADAPRGKVVAHDLNTGDAREVVAQHDTDILGEVRLTASGFVLQYSADASHRVQLADSAGTLGDHVDLGELSSVIAIDASDRSNTVTLKSMSFTDRGSRHVLEVEGARVRSHRMLPNPSDVGLNATTQRIRTESSDGAVVPAFLVRPADDDASTPRPTLIWGYGGFRIPMYPTFHPLQAAWVEAGGVLVVPNLRGGGEFGTEWHLAGTKRRKQQVFDDLFAIAEHLIASGVTTSDMLAVHGASNGGLLAGAALTQRPDLWAAVLPSVGVLDMLRYAKFTIGWAWMGDYGDPEDPDEFAALYAYSPLHAITTGTAYPPTLITTADHDDRVVPAHSFKFAARLQEAQRTADTDAPIMLSVATRTGHGGGKPKDVAIAEFTDKLAFAAHFTGLVT